MAVFRNYTSGVNFYVTPKMRQELDNLSESRRITVSELLREIIEDRLSKEQKSALQEQPENFLNNLISNPKEHNNE